MAFAIASKRLLNILTAWELLKATWLECFTLPLQMLVMHRKDFDYYSSYSPRSFPDQKQLITYSFNEKEKTITGIMLEKKDLIFLYEYRGEYIGTEFFISFSKESISYKLIKVEEMAI